MIDLFALLEVYNTYNHNSLYYNIAQSILKQYGRLEMGSLEGFADSLHISPSSLNRFLKILGYDSFTSYRYEHAKREEYYLFDHSHGQGRAESMRDYTAQVLKRTAETLECVDEERIGRLLQEMEAKENTIFVGLPMPSEVWWLELELVLLGRRTSAFLAPNDQIEAIQNCGPGDLVIGLDIVRQDDMMLSRMMKEAKERGAVTACICHAPKRSMEEEIDILLSYQGSNTRIDQFALAILLNYMADRLRQKYLKGGERSARSQHL